MQLTQTDRSILRSYCDFLEGIADYMGPGYEFVLHSLECLDHSVIKIVNGHYTGRVEGAPITDLALDMLAGIQENGATLYQSYFTRNNRGAPMKSTTIAIRGESERIIGLLCINFYLETPFSDIIGNYTARESHATLSEKYPSSFEELMGDIVDDVRRDVMQNKAIPAGRKKREIIQQLSNKGYFSIKDSVPHAAEVLKISKNTVYMHLRKIQEEQQKIEE